MHQAVERDQQHEQERELDVVGKPEAKPVGELEQGDKRDEPAAPHRDHCGVPDHVRVEPTERRAARPKDAGCCPDWMKAPALARRLRHLLPRMRVRTWGVSWSRRSVIDYQCSHHCLCPQERFIPAGSSTITPQRNQYAITGSKLVSTELTKCRWKNSVSALPSG